MCCLVGHGKSAATFKGLACQPGIESKTTQDVSDISRACVLWVFTAEGRPSGGCIREQPRRSQAKLEDIGISLNFGESLFQSFEPSVRIRCFQLLRTQLGDSYPEHGTGWSLRELHSP